MSVQSDGLAFSSHSVVWNPCYHTSVLPIFHSLLFLHNRRSWYPSSRDTDGFLCSNSILRVYDNKPALVSLLWLPLFNSSVIAPDFQSLLRLARVEDSKKPSKETKVGLEAYIQHTFSHLADCACTIWMGIILMFNILIRFAEILALLYHRAQAWCSELMWVLTLNQMR